MVRRKTTKPKTEPIPETTKLLIEVLARTNALFWPDRSPFVQRAAQVRHQRQRSYLESGIDLSGSGNTADRQRFGRLIGDLEAAGLVTVCRSAGRREGVKLTLLGDTVARKLTAWRTQAETWSILERAGDLDRRAVRKSLPEHLHANIPEWNSTAENNSELTHFHLDASCFFCAGYLTAHPDTDLPPKYWVSVTEAGRAALAAGKPSDAPPEVEFSQAAGDLCDVLERQAAAELKAAKPDESEIIVRVPCGVGWGGIFSDWFLPGMAPEGAVSFSEHFAALRRKREPVA